MQPSRTQAAACSLSLLLFADPACAGIQFDQLNQTYDGGVAYPEVSVDGALSVPRFTCRPIDPSTTKAVFSNIPASIAWSYPSLSFSAQQTSELGNLVQLAGTQRVADHIEVVMVTWASASRYPDWSSADPTGFTHPVTARIHQPVAAAGGGTAFQLVDESTVHIHIPWKPALLPNGTAYPYNGYAFRVILPLSARTTVPDSCVVSIAYQTGVPGPSNELNVALSSAKPGTGTDPDPSSVFWIRNGQWFYPATGWGGVGSPMITLNTRQTALPAPVLSPAVAPLHAGVYHLNASVASPVLEAAAVLRISKAVPQIRAEGLVRSVADPPAGPLITTDPPGLAVEVTYGGASAQPMVPGTHPFEARVNTRDHEGILKGNLVLTAERYGQWRDLHLPGQAADLTHGTADPDGDGICNWLEYASGGDPLAPGPAVLPERVPGGVRLVYRLRRGMDEVRIQPEFSSDLRTWSPADESSVQSGGLWEEHTVGSNQPHGFFRFRAWSSEPR